MGHSAGWPGEIVGVGGWGGGGLGGVGFGLGMCGGRSGLADGAGRGWERVAGNRERGLDSRERGRGRDESGDWDGSGGGSGDRMAAGAGAGAGVEAGVVRHLHRK